MTYVRCIIALAGTDFLKRVFGGDGVMETWDRQGRILLTGRLKEHAGIKKEVTIVGAMDCIENQWQRIDRLPDWRCMGRGASLV